jgi:hypothetical protein
MRRHTLRRFANITTSTITKNREVGNGFKALRQQQQYKRILAHHHPIACNRYLTTITTTTPSYYDLLFADQILDSSLKITTSASSTRQELLHYLKLRREKDNTELIDKNISNKVLGVILEDATNKLAGTTVVAAYYDGTAAFYNGKQYHHLSSEKDEYLDKLITNFFHFAGERKNEINIHIKDGERGGPPDNGIVRISFLTPKGILRGEFKQFNQVFEVVTAATDLGLYLIMNS